MGRNERLIPHVDQADLSNGKPLDLTRKLRVAGLNRDERARYLVELVDQIDKHGYDAQVIVRKKRGRPSNLSRFLQRQAGFSF